MRMKHRTPTVTRLQEDNLSKTTSSQLVIKIIVKQKRTFIIKNGQNRTQLTKRARINNTSSTTTALSPLN